MITALLRIIGRGWLALGLGGKGGGSAPPVTGSPVVSVCGDTAIATGPRGRTNVAPRTAGPIDVAPPITGRVRVAPPIAGNVTIPDC